MTHRRAGLPSIALVLAVVLLVVLMASGAAPASGVAPRKPPSPSPTPTLTPPPSRTSQWVIDENAKPGTSSWRIPAGTRKGIAGYADHISAKAGETIKLFVKTRSPSFHVEAYRLGYYQGLGGRLIWTSSEVASARQPRATVDPVTYMVRAPWNQSLQVPITSAWVQGTYVLKLVSSAGGQTYIPFVVRNDASTADLVIQAEATTWQAYNRWGGYSLYKGHDGGFATRSRVVSFDRPFGGRGAAGLLHELPFVVLVERLGLDVTYWTDVDLHQRPELLKNHSSLVSLDHDEYWSTRMRDGITAARDSGVNLAFFGGNAIYRHIRFEASPLGSERVMVSYKTASEDPLFGIDDAEVTSSWRSGPVPRPESDILGAMYACADAHADLVVDEADNWVFAGTGVVDGGTIPDLVDMEYDRIHPEAPTPANIQILAHSPILCKGVPDYADMTYYTAQSNAGVLNASSQGWVKALRCGDPVQTDTCDARAVRITQNVLDAFSVGPAGIAHPSVPNLAKFGITLQQPINP